MYWGFREEFVANNREEEKVCLMWKIFCPFSNVLAISLSISSFQHGIVRLVQSV